MECFFYVFQMILNLMDFDDHNINKHLYCFTYIILEQCINEPLKYVAPIFFNPEGITL